ncbi:MAG: triple tyrosine motif-containing protein [Paludibacter sp.]|nr:triple tyrosine motif-containing protein [Paludibacter sp.]
MIFRNYKITLLMFWLVGSLSYASHPLVRNFTKKMLNAGAQNWDIVQTKSDWMYFANNSGMLEFDGDRWTVFPVPNYSNVRSLLYDSVQNRIYAGAFNEFGYYERSFSGLVSYVSLSNKLKKQESNFTEIWNISANGEAVFFQSDHNVFRSSGNKLRRFHFDDKISSSAVVHDLFVMATPHRGTLYQSGDLFLPFPNSELLKNKKVCAILPFRKNQILFVTDFDGIFVFNGEKVERFETYSDDFLRSNQVFCAAIYNDQLAIGTVRNGLLVKNLTDGSDIFCNTQTGLQNNTILSISFDKTGNLWLGLDKGIDYVMINSPIYDLFGNSNLYGAGYASLLRENSLYLGTNQGLYVSEYNGGKSLSEIKLVQGIQGQVWSLDQIDSQVFCSSDKGVFVIATNGTARQIEGLGGAWGLRLLKNHPYRILGSSYQGFFILKKENQKWIFSHFIKGFNESGGMFGEDNESGIWVSHWMKGVFRLRLNESLDSVENVSFYGSDKGFPTTHNNTLFPLSNDMIFSTEGGFYRYNNALDSIEESAFFNRLFGIPPFSVKMYESPSADFWCVSGGKIMAAFRTDSNTYKVDSVSFFSLRNRLVPGFENLSFLPGQKVLIGTEDGFSLVDETRLKPENNTFRIAIRNVYITSARDSLVRGFVPVNLQNEIPEFKSNQNSVRFEFVGTEFRSEKSMLYSYKLEGFESEWSQFSPVNSKEFTKLSHGTYTFRVRAMNLYNSQIAETSFTFSISPPWYLTIAAFVVYGVILLVCLYLLLRYIRYKTAMGAREMEARKEAEMKEQEKRFKADAKEKEKEIIALKNQKLQYELRHKSQDLASSTMNLIRKNEILLEINKNLDKISDELSENAAEKPALIKRIKRMQDEIRVNIEHDNNWKKFQENFDLVYENYLKRLGEQFPALTVSDKKLCAYLKMDLSSKDIAPLLNMSYRSVEMSRYRLRKKLNLDREVNLTEFLQSF